MFVELLNILFCVISIPCNCEIYLFFRFVGVGVFRKFKYLIYIFIFFHFLQSSVQSRQSTYYGGLSEVYTGSGQDLGPVPVKVRPELSG